VRFTRPWEDLDAARARALVDPDGMFGDLAGLDVLCLAGGGGQQSAAFGLLGARVTVVDFSRAQLERDRVTAARYGLQARLIEGDIRDLSALDDDAFDVVWNAHSINFVPDPRPVFDGVARVLRRGGLYRLQWTNPFVHGIWDAPWTGTGYPLRHRYVDGGELSYDDPVWNVTRADGSRERVPGPREWRHGLGTVVNGLIARGLEIRHLREEMSDAVDATPGTDAHRETIAPFWLTLWAARGPKGMTAA
jgi:SAM-dependent methyltransferase